MPLPAREPSRDDLRQHHDKNCVDDKGHSDASLRTVCEGSLQHFDDGQQGQGVDQYLAKCYFHVGGKKKPQVEKRFYDAACQTKKDRQGQQAQDKSRAYFPDTCDVTSRERGYESPGPTVRESLLHCGLCHGSIRGLITLAGHLDGVRQIRMRADESKGEFVTANRQVSVLFMTYSKIGINGFCIFTWF